MITDAERKTLARAARILERLALRGPALGSPAEVGNWLRHRYAGDYQEHFGVIFLDNQHRVIAAEELFHGTIDGASVYPRTVTLAALNQGAAAVVFYHNHPSGIAEPSQADQRITGRLKDSLALIDVRVIDHIIAGDGFVSFAERGLL
jgi:DNA repair protein RadC